MRRCANPENQAHVDELERLIKKQTKDIRQFQDDVQMYERYTTYLEKLLEDAGISYDYNFQKRIAGDKQR